VIVDAVRAEDIELRPWTEADAEWYVDARDELVFEFTTEVRDLTAEQVVTAMRRVAASRTEAAWAIWTKEGGIVGNIALELDRREAEVSYFLCAVGRGHGYATEAVKAAATWAFAHLAIDRVVARVAVSNRASTAVLRRAGFTSTDAGYHQNLREITYWSLPRPRPSAGGWPGRPPRAVGSSC
jgi:RimJ/RimL family protein N-acetyltransferase